MANSKYSPEFRQQALVKAMGRGSRSLSDVASELGVNEGTLKHWLKISRKRERLGSFSSDEASHWSPSDRLLALQESHGLKGEALHAWCREKGLFEYQLVAWRDAFCSDRAPQPSEAVRADKAELKALQHEHDKLQRELLRKDRALAEAAALLVLQKKFQALLGGEE